jgi:periplasmic protein TonB
VNLPSGGRGGVTPGGGGSQGGAGVFAKVSPGGASGAAGHGDFGGAAYLHNPNPIYPKLAKRMGMEGTVRLNVLVGQKGRVAKIEIAESSGHELLDRAATEAVRDWRFIAARQGDSLQDEWVQVPVTFELKK